VGTLDQIPIRTRCSPTSTSRDRSERRGESVDQVDHDRVHGLTVIGVRGRTRRARVGGYLGWLPWWSAWCSGTVCTALEHDNEDHRDARALVPVGRTRVVGAVLGALFSVAVPTVVLSAPGLTVEKPRELAGRPRRAGHDCDPAHHPAAEQRHPAPCGVHRRDGPQWQPIDVANTDRQLGRCGAGWLRGAGGAVRLRSPTVRSSIPTPGRWGHFMPCFEDED
jgi:hypothetical protein